VSRPAKEANCRVAPLEPDVPDIVPLMGDNCSRVLDGHVNLHFATQT